MVFDSRGWPSFVTVFTDCDDINAEMRQEIEWAKRVGVKASVKEVTNPYQAAGQILDALDAGAGGTGIIFLNDAGRDGEGKKFPNGAPFGYFQVDDILVISTLTHGNPALSLVKKILKIPVIHQLDIPQIMGWARERRFATNAEAQMIIETQFRSLHFVPRFGEWMFRREQVPVLQEITFAEHVHDAPPNVWWVDQWKNKPYGNCKTNLLLSELPGFQIYSPTFREVPFLGHLKDVPNGVAAFVEGSSGNRKNRLIELVQQGGSAAKLYGLSSGSVLV